MSKKHVVQLLFIYDEEDDWHEVRDKDSAIYQALKELHEQSFHELDFDYELKD